MDLIFVIQLLLSFTVGLNVYLVCVSWLSKVSSNFRLLALRKFMTEHASVLGITSTFYGFWLSVSAEAFTEDTFRVALSAAIPSTIGGVIVLYGSSLLWMLYNPKDTVTDRET